MLIIAVYPVQTAEKRNKKKEERRREEGGRKEDAPMTGSIGGANLYTYTSFMQRSNAFRIGSSSSDISSICFYWVEA